MEDDPCQGTIPEEDPCQEIFPEEDPFQGTYVEKPENTETYSEFMTRLRNTNVQDEITDQVRIKLQFDIENRTPCEVIVSKNTDTYKKMFSPYLKTYCSSYNQFDEVGREVYYLSDCSENLFKQFIDFIRGSTVSWEHATPETPRQLMELGKSFNVPALVRACNHILFPVGYYPD